MAVKPFVPRKVINIHTHIKRGEDIARRVALWKEQGAVRTCVLCSAHPPGEPNWGVTTNDELAPHLAAHSDHLIGFGGVNLSGQPDNPSVVGELRAKGFSGLKCIMPAKPYDDDSYMPLYEQAYRLQMPILFHTGFLSFPPGYKGPCRVDHMRPVRLERIAREFPELPIIGAHLGTPWQAEAIRLLSAPNVFYDISGGSASAAHGSLMKKALAPFPGADLKDPDEHPALKLFAEKLLFGTDNPPVSRWVPRAEEIMDYLHISSETRECFFWKSAAKLLRIEV